MEKNVLVSQLIEDPDKGRDYIRQNMLMDIKSAVNTLQMLATNKALQDVYVEELWRRWVAFYESEKRQPEIEFNGKEADNAVR